MNPLDGPARDSQTDANPAGATAVLTAAEDGDPVLAALDETREQYLRAREAWERQAGELRQARMELMEARDAERRAAEEVKQARAQLGLLRERADRHRQRADRLAAALKSIHRALFEGNVFQLILKACMNITGATRGLYVTAWGRGELRVRAAVEVDGYPRAAPSPFLRALCARVLDDEKSFVANRPEELAGLPERPGPGERFRNCLAAPAVLLKEFNGIVILADKAGGDFDEEDVEQVLSVGDQAAVAVENQRLHHDLVKAYFAIVGVLADAVEAKDPYTHGHCELVAHYARRVAERLNLSPAERSVACYGGLLHDVGKIGVSDGVLNKPGKLMPEEWELMRSHVRVGRDLLAHVPALEHVAGVVLHHHERYDGGGYPEGLQGESIPLPARIVGVADAYCAMISKRSYKESMNPAEARAELVRYKGIQFDPRVVDAFLAVLDEEAEEQPHGGTPPPVLGDPDDFRLILHPPHGAKAR